ncbi:MAG: hypothetical protein PHU25_01055 [Deltaproteobacteria bacterium]|nr:hypothetical protein [Deltaproteobacteria bacterium]
MLLPSSCSTFRWSIAENLVETCIKASHRPLFGDWIGSLHSYAAVEHEPPKLRLTIDIRPLPDDLITHARCDFGYDAAGEITSAKLIGQSFVGRLVREQGRWLGQFTIGGEISGSMENVLRIGLSLLCEARGDLLLHASAVEREGAVYVFSGPSGAGKTTIATELTAGATPVALERVVLRIRDRDHIEVHSTPFSDPTRVLLGPRVGRMARLCFIEQADRHACDPLAPFAAVQRLFAQTLVCSRRQGQLTRTLDAVSRVAETGRCMRLLFCRDPGFWNMIV